MIRKNNLYGIVVWFNPTFENVENIKSYIDEVNLLIVIDNSDFENSKLLNTVDSTKIKYIANKKNNGIAKALNQGCQFAIELGAEWVLTMDQDSRFLNNDLSLYIQNSNKYADFDKVAIFAAYHYDSRNNAPIPIFEDRYSKITYTMTSGNLISIEKIQKIGSFMEDLFIDWVDEEFCLRVCKYNLLIVQINDVNLEHFVGDGMRKIKFIGFTKYIEDYNPIRFYYITRNVLVLCKLYPSEAHRLKKRWYRLVRKVVFYDNFDKVLKIKYIIHGLWDFWAKKTGPYLRKQNIK